ncbi:putative bifunctional diguanylate cyclase/phosphodiesterase [Gottschalkia acidurici]|uniref:putative bifunctional diguanylate cyclase/phosphodiesterase n=1 Tax=Clostridium acidurici TaxID=1556 RepID=UPI0002DE5A96|nr:EAL domain-containing protein [Gottschalkia acidurici]
MILYQFIFYNYKTTEYDNDLYSVINDLSSDLKQDIYDNFGIIKAFARDLDSESSMTEENFNTLAKKYIVQYPNIKYLLHKNKYTVTNIVYPLKENKYQLSKSLDGRTEELKAIESSLKFRDITIGYPYDYKNVDDKSRTISIRYPYFKDDEFGGLLILAIDSSKVVERRLSSNLLERYDFKFYDSNMNEFFSSTSQKVLNGNIEQFKVEDIVWNIEIKDNINSKKTILFHMILNCIIFIVLFSIFIFLEVKIFNKNEHIEELKSLKEKIKHLAYYDSLTNLPNRPKIITVLNKYISNSSNNLKKCAVIFIDLDSFKSINDNLGHSYGDKLLVLVSEAFNKFTNNKFIASRVGGDEFVFLMLDIENSIDAENLCSKLLDEISSTFYIQDKEVSTTASIGVAMYPEHGDDVDELFKNADTAMYKAKLNGKNKYALFDKSMSAEIERKIYINRFLKEAIANQELSVHYQPQLELKSNQFYDMEALLRWNNSSLGYMSPSEFIPVAEETGLIRDIGEWTIKEVCKQLNIWDKLGYEFRSVSINISPIQLYDKSFVSKVKNILETESINISRVTFEITEQALIKDLDQCINTIKELSILGFTISLDDFGTGYSSLSYLAKLPIDILKIDKSFIDNITSDEYDLALLKGIIDLAHSIKLKVITEGIECRDQFDILTNMGSDFIQGYYFSKPIAGENICKFKDSLLKKSDL